MKEEKVINEEVKQLLDSLEQHGRNARRQQELSDLIDKLAAGTDAKRRRLFPLWWAIGAAAACLLLWLLVKPAVVGTPKQDGAIFVEETENVGSTPSSTNDEIHEESITEEELMAENATDKQPHTQNPKEETRNGLLRFSRNDGKEETNNENGIAMTEIVGEKFLAEARPKEPSTAIETNDTMNIESNNIPTTNEEKLPTKSSHQRRVIRSLNLVCYECQKEPEYVTKTESESKTIFGQPQDPNMKNGSLAFEVKLH